MFTSPAKIATIILGLSQSIGVSALPADAHDNTQGIIITHNASDFFPGAKGDLSPFHVDVRYTGYNSSTEAWLSSLDPATGKDDKEKAQILTSAAYAKPFDENDAEMVADRDDMLATIAGASTSARSLDRRSTFKTSAAHAVIWHTCAAVFSCLSGVTCTFNENIGKAPRSQCENQGGQNCCLSWSTYNVQVGFFQRTWTNCNAEVNDENKSSASCEGYGTDSQGGDVCLSNRATGCT